MILHCIATNRLPTQLCPQGPAKFSQFTNIGPLEKKNDSTVIDA